MAPVDKQADFLSCWQVLDEEIQESALGELIGGCLVEAVRQSERGVAATDNC